MFGVHDHLSQKYKGYELWHKHPRRSRHHFILFLIVAVGVTFGMIDTTQESPLIFATVKSRSHVSVRALTDQMLTTIQAYELAPRDARERLLSIVLSIVDARNEALHTLARRDPDLAALESLPPELIYSFPREIANLLEEDLTYLPPVPLDTPAKYSAAAATLATDTCVQGTITAALSPVSQVARAPGTTLTYTLAVTNTDSAACPSVEYTVAIAPLEWISSSTPLTITVLAGSTSNSEITITSPAPQSVGLTAIKARVSDSSRSAEAHATLISYPDLPESETIEPAHMLEAQRERPHDL